MKGRNRDYYHKLRDAGPGACFCLRYAKVEDRPAEPISIWAYVTEVRDMAVDFRVMNGEWPGSLRCTVEGIEVATNTIDGQPVISDLLPYQQSHSYWQSEPIDAIYDWHETKEP